MAVFVQALPEGFLLTRFCGAVVRNGGYHGIRFLYSPAAIGLDGYVKGRDRIKTQFVGLDDKFRTKMLDFSDPTSTHMIFTEDLKNMIHLTEAKSDDLDLVYKMMKRFIQQNKEVRFGSFVFGPVIMRMYYYLNKPDEALEVFKDPELEDLFAQLGSYQILMDLLYENERYQDVLDVFDIVKQRQHQEAKYPKNAVILVFAACFKFNTEESFKHGMDLWKELLEFGHIPARRTVTFAAGLALNQNAPHIALEILSCLTQQTYVTVRNLRVAALADVGRPEDTLPVLRSVIDDDVPSWGKHTFSEDVIQKVRVSVDGTENQELIYNFQQIEKRLREGGHISEVTLAEQLCIQIEDITRQSDRATNQKFLAASFSRQDPRTYKGSGLKYQRPGLQDMY